MLKEVIFETKTKDDPMLIAQEKLGINKSFIVLEKISEKKGFFGIGASQQYKAKVRSSLVLLGKEYLDNILKSVNLEYQMEFRSLDNDTHLVYNLLTNENGLVIGRRAQGLDGLQILLKQFLSQFTEEKIIVNLDVGGYHQKRIKNLEILATKTAKEVARTRQEATLTDLNSFERRVIHTKLSEWDNVETVSVGEGEDRKLIIKFKPREQKQD